MTSSTNAIDFFQEFRNIPQKWEEAANFFNWWLLQNTNYLNSKTIGIYSPQIIPCGKQFLVNGITYDAFRETISVGALPDATTASYPHNIDTTIGFRLVDLYGLANDTNDNLYFRFDMWSIAGQDIMVNMDSTNINITTGSDYSSYNDSFVVIEYIQGVA